MLLLRTYLKRRLSVFTDITVFVDQNNQFGGRFIQFVDRLQIFNKVLSCSWIYLINTSYKNRNTRVDYLQVTSINTNGCLWNVAFSDVLYVCRPNPHVLCDWQRPNCSIEDVSSLGDQPTTDHQVEIVNPDSWHLKSL